MAVTPYEAEFCNHLGVVARDPPDYKALEEEFEAFNLEQDPWEVRRGPPIPELMKEFSTAPEDFECLFFQEIERTAMAAVSATGEPASGQLPRALLVSAERELTARLLQCTPRWGSALKPPRKKARKEKEAPLRWRSGLTPVQYADDSADEEESDGTSGVSFRVRNPGLVVDAAGMRQGGLWGGRVHTPPTPPPRSRKNANPSTPPPLSGFLLLCAQCADCRCRHQHAGCGAPPLLLWFLCFAGSKGGDERGW